MGTESRRRLAMLKSCCNAERQTLRHDACCGSLACIGFAMNAGPLMACPSSSSRGPPSPCMEGAQRRCACAVHGPAQRLGSSAAWHGMARLRAHSAVQRVVIELTQEQR